MEVDGTNEKDQIIAFGFHDHPSLRGHPLPFIFFRQWHIYRWSGRLSQWSSAFFRCATADNRSSSSSCL